MLITPLILCGGSGTRLWPASRVNRPKQFLPLLGPRSSFGETLLRVADPELFGRAVVIANREHRSLVVDQVREIGVEIDLVLEPEARDSGPAIAAGAAYITARDGDDAAVLSLAADHVIRDVDAFRSDCRRALEAARAGSIVTFGIIPTFPSTEYGYIEPGGALPNGALGVGRFIEKPGREAAERYLRQGYLWNSGNFLFKARILLGEYAAREPQTLEAVRAAMALAIEEGGSLTLDRAAFARAEKRSIDYAVMETTDKAAVLKASFDWSDVGSWDAVHALLPQDGDGNAARGPGAFVDAHNNVAVSEGPTVAIVGLDDLAVIATPDAILVARRTDAAGVRKLVEQLRQENLARGSGDRGGESGP
jgi:mannose-1-phosphate guanylyltransferase/mannose-6-phosphate isomerase